MSYPVRIRGVQTGGHAPPSGEERRDFRTLVFGAQAVAAAAVALLAALPVLTGVASWPVRLAALVLAAVLAGGHLAWFGTGRFRRPVLALAVSAAFGLVPLLPLGAPWSPAAGFFAGGVLLVTRSVRAVPAALLACVAAGLGAALTTGSGDAGVGGAVSAAVAALTLFGLGTAARLVAEREDEVRELKRQVIAEERKRFSRDLHDLLGLSLSAITLKGELVDRLVPGRPEQAKAELAELLVMSRRALADVRRIAAGYRELSLDDECRAAADVLNAAGTRVTVDRSCLGDLPPRVATALATVLREGVTNVVRHSTASWCAFSVSTVDGTAWLEILNDGAGGVDGSGADSGAGLRNLADRVEDLNGTLTTETGPDGTHRLLVAIPLGSLEGRRRRAG
ncbi:sensor histidine kinase [Amycolatopsis mediterranei]|uniref:sensor histidine kinase n=1 Tax=Amycolatopsis mediterranei TaxID=33910 RepID=UPI0002DF555F|nr:sensor histidine kinase [Amycolatopsis mediterranei]UZF73601.1 sensor histidine kinase [Amycolatopsis mediterranei]